MERPSRNFSLPQAIENSDWGIFASPNRDFTENSRLGAPVMRSGAPEYKWCSQIAHDSEVSMQEALK